MTLGDESIEKKQDEWGRVVSEAKKNDPSRAVL